MKFENAIESVDDYFCESCGKCVTDVEYCAECGECACMCDCDDKME